MPYNVITGVYTPPGGAESAATGQVIQSSIWNSIHTDLATALTLVEQQLQATFGQRNIIGSNGGLEVWQRGAGGAASFSLSASSTAYTADRWYLTTNANQAATVTQVAGIANGSSWAAKVQRNSGQTGIGGMTFGFPLDTDEINMMIGSFVALSFVAKAGANWSPASGTLDVFLELGTGNPVKFSGGTYTGNTQAISSSANLTTSPTRYTFVSTAVIPSTTAQAEVALFWTPVGTAGVDDSFTIDNVQLEILPNANSALAGFELWPFERSLLACKRHFQKTFGYSVAPVQNAGTATNELRGIAGKAGAAAEFLEWRLPVSLRTGSPVITTFNPSASNVQMRDETAAADCSSTTTTGGREAVDITATGNGSTAVGNTLGIHITADAGI